MSDSREARILECIDRNLDVFGLSAKEFLYYNLEIQRNLRRQDIPRRFDEFLLGLRMFFGEAGTRVVEESIARDIKNSFRLALPTDSLGEVMRAVMTNDGREML